MILHRPDADEIRRLTPSQQASYWRARFEEIRARLEGLEVLYQQACRDRDLFLFRLGDTAPPMARAHPGAGLKPPQPAAASESSAGKASRPSTPATVPERSPKPTQVIEPHVIYDEAAGPSAAPFRLGEYTLYSSTARKKGGGTRLVYFFSNEARPGGTPCPMPAGFEVHVDKETGIPFLRELRPRKGSGGKKRSSGPT